MPMTANIKKSITINNATYGSAYDTNTHAHRTLSFNHKMNTRHLKNVGPIRYCEPPLHCQSPGVASRTPAIAIAQAVCDVHDNNNKNNDDNA